MNFFLRLRNVVLLMLALLSIARYGRRSAMPVTPRAVLVVQPAKLGDMVCITPVLRALRRHLPGARILVMGDAVNKELLDGSPDVDEYIVFDGTRVRATVRRLRRARADVALIRGTGFVGLAVALLSGIPAVVAPRVAGGRALETKTYKLLLPYVRTVDFAFGEYMPRQFLRLLEPLGIREDDTAKHLVYSPAAGARAAALLAGAGIDPAKDLVVGIAPSAGNKIKEWPPERFAAVADYLIEKHHAKVLIIGGPGDGPTANEMLRHTKNPAAITNVQGKLSIDELKALVATLGLFISVDTGPIYIAEAFGVPTVDIVGPMDEREQPPRGPKHAVVVAKRERPALHIMNARMYDRVEARRQVEAISVDQVVRAIETVL